MTYVGTTLSADRDAARAAAMGRHRRAGTVAPGTALGRDHTAVVPRTSVHFHCPVWRREPYRLARSEAGCARRYSRAVHADSHLRPGHATLRASAEAGTTRGPVCDRPLDDARQRGSRRWHARGDDWPYDAAAQHAVLRIDRRAAAAARP